MFQFEDKLQEIEKALESKRSKWDLDAVPSVDYDDIKQIIMTHIYKKWHLWDQSKAIEPWLSRVVSNQFKNLLRNHYGNFVRPCLKCKYNMGGTSCQITKSNVQDNSCSEYADWEKRKKSAYDIKLAVTIENHTNEIQARRDDFVDLDIATEKVAKELKKHLTEKQYTAFRMLFVENHSEEKVANYLGYKTTEKKRSAGYKQIKNLKKIFQIKVKAILEEKDIL
jgi:DNA-directed RNA polymerase specialized sigma24 family protein|tara:strand:- start:175 stop:846 length:672 start_codon:yes stop_codon:yes gene_type:complete